MPPQVQIFSHGLVRATALLALFGLLAVAGCSSDSTTGSGGQTPKFTPQDAQIVVGDTIRWVAVSGDHSVTSGTGSADPNVGQLFDQNLAQGNSFTRVFNSVGVFDYFCRPHESQGMTGTVTVSAPTTKTTTVTASGVTFSPANLTINVGDAVKWTSSGTHTITSGASSSTPGAGDMFDETLSDAQTFTFVFNTAGSFPYFCRFHEANGMKGTVTVLERTATTVEVDATI